MIPIKYFRRGYTIAPNHQTYPAYEGIGSIYEAALLYHKSRFIGHQNTVLHCKRGDQLIGLYMASECPGLTILADIQVKSPINWYMVNDSIKLISYSISRKK